MESSATSNGAPSPEPSQESRTGRRWSRDLALGLLGLLAILHGASLVLAGVGPVDDDYIVYRYAGNWIETGALSFHGAEGGWVEGFSSPLWFLLVAAGLRLGLDPVVFSPAIGLLCAGGLTLFAGAAARGIQRRGQEGARRSLWLLAPLLLALSPAVAWHAVAGLGTVPMAAAVGMCLWARATERRGAMAVASVVAVLFRLEALIAVVPLGWSLPARRIPERVRACLPALLAAALVTGLRYRLFGELAPNTYFTKALPLGEELQYGASYLLGSVPQGGLAVLGILALVNRSAGKARSAAAAIAVASGGALGYVLLVGGDWMVYDRFLVPFAAPFAVGAALVCVAIFRRLAVPGAALFALGLIAMTAFGLRPHQREQAIFEYHFFERWWLRVGEELSRRAPEGASVAVSPIGAIGWRSGLAIVDVLGLTHDAFRELPPDLEGVGVKGHHRHDGGWVLDQRPSYLLLGNVTLQPDSGALAINPWEGDIVQDPRFVAEYVAESATVRDDDGQSRTLPYFRRRDSAPPLFGR